MEVTIQEAAARLGKSVRQIRYLIQQGRLPARKVSGRWRIALEEQPTSDRQARATARKAERLREVVEDTLSLPPPRKRYSITDLRAFQIGRPLYHRAAQELGEAHPAAGHLRAALDQLALGCHRFHAADKAAAYQEARDTLSRAVAALALEPAPVAAELLGVIEQDLLAAVAGLIRRLEPRR